MLTTALGVVSALTVLATGLLSLSLIFLHPPRANYQTWSLMAILFVAQSGLTLVWIAGVSGGWIRGLLLAGALGVMGIGGSWAYQTVTGTHFEGYALVLGSLLVVQGALTIACLTPGLIEQWEQRRASSQPVD